MDSLAPARSALRAFASDKFLSPFPKRLKCPNCSSPKLDRQCHNTKVCDFVCPSCELRYQLKGQQSRIGSSIADGAYAAMMHVIRMDETPNFYFMHYEIAGRDGRAAQVAVPLPMSAGAIPAALPPVTSQRDVPTNEFTTADLYAFERELEALHPDNGLARSRSLGPRGPLASPNSFRRFPSGSSATCWTRFASNFKCCVT